MEDNFFFTDTSLNIFVVHFEGHVCNFFSARELKKFGSV